MSVVATMSPALPLESERFARALHALLHELDPARWRDEREATLRVQLAQLQAQLSALASQYSEHADQRLEVTRARLHELEALLRSHAPDALTRAEELRDAWMRFRTSAMPAYEGLAASLKAVDVRVPSLRPTNYRRNAFHVLAAALCIGAAQLIPHLTPWGFKPVMALAIGAAVIGWSMELGRRFSVQINRLLMWVFRPVAHPHEAHRVNSATWYVTALALLSLSRDPMLCSIALAVLGVADPAAAIIGKRFGHHRLANGRSLEGAAAFILSGTLAAWALISLLHPEQPAMRALALCAVAATSGGITELLIKRVDDNLAIPVSAAIAAGLLGLLI